MKTVILRGMLVAWFLWYSDGTAYVPRVPAISPVGPAGEALTGDEQKTVCLHAAAMLRGRGIPAFCAPSADPAVVLGREGRP